MTITVMDLHELLSCLLNSHAEFAGEIDELLATADHMVDTALSSLKADTPASVFTRGNVEALRRRAEGDFSLDGQGIERMIASARQVQQRVTSVLVTGASLRCSAAAVERTAHLKGFDQIVSHAQHSHRVGERALQLNRVAIPVDPKDFAAPWQWMVLDLVRDARKLAEVIQGEVAHDGIPRWIELELASQAIGDDAVASDQLDDGATLWGWPWPEQALKAVRALLEVPDGEGRSAKEIAKSTGLTEHYIRRDFRDRLLPNGLKNRPRVGYYLEPASKARIRAALDAAERDNDGS